MQTKSLPIPNLTLKESTLNMITDILLSLDDQGDNNELTRHTDKAA